MQTHTTTTPQAATHVSKEDASRLEDLSKQLSSETCSLAKLRASCSGLQKKAAEIQVSGAHACVCVCACARG